MSDETASRQAELDELDRQIQIRKTALAMDVPPSFLQNARSTEEIEQHAREALQWRSASAPPAPPTTAAVSPYNGVGQISRNMLPYLGPAGTMEAWRAGRLEQAGAAKPPERRDGEQHRNAAP